MKPCTVFLLFLASSVWVCDGTPRTNTVTNEDIRKAILQVVNVLQSTESKLERHEARERQWGESLKKSLIIIDKRIKVIEPLKGAFIRLDERLAAVESILLQKDERERVQMQKTATVVEDIQKNLPVLLEKMKNEIIDKLNSNEPPAQITEPTVSKKDFQKMEKDIIDKVEKVSRTIGGMEKELGKIRDENIGMKDINNKSTESLEKVKRQLDNSEQLLQKYESKLAEYNNKIPLIDPRSSFKEDTEWQNNFLNELQQQKSQVSRIMDDLRQVGQKIADLPRKQDLMDAEARTMQIINQLRSTSAPGVPSNLTDTLNAIRRELETNHNEINSTLSDLYDISNGLAAGIPASYEKISNDIQTLSKLEQVMMQTADSVLDTKKRVEYGIHQIVGDIGNKIKEGSKDTVNAVNERFDAFEVSVLDEDSGALANLTSKIGEEIDQVWRQIGIMHQQMTASADTLNKLQNQTDTYVTGSLKSMSNMKDKVGQITGRMTEVDDDLNYLLGRLSLVTQEFNQIRTGLGKALDEIKSSFQTVQDKIKNAGPGPHNISSNEVVST